LYDTSAFPCSCAAATNWFVHKYNVYARWVGKTGKPAERPEEILAL